MKITLKKLKELEHDYFKTSNEVDQLENKLTELREHKLRLRFFYEQYKKEEVLKNE